MLSGISADFKEIIRSRTDLVALIGETVALSPQRGGSDYVGLCPFHEDHNPSFHVYPDRQSWRCWVCNEGGDCFSFVEKTDGCGFFEALKMLAERADVELPRRGTRETERHAQAKSEKEQMYAALRWVEDRLHECLLNSAEAREARGYLAERGVSPEMIERFRLGYHPDDWEWLLQRARGKFPEPILHQARILGENKFGRVNDSHIFIDRVIFPIHDPKGRTISFGGRVLPGREGPKYYNGNDSELFNKSETLYGFPLAKDAIRKSRQVLIVEGYTDCIAAHQAGLCNVVGVLGTALTEQHVGQLKHIAEEIILLFDGDAAGQLNADRVVVKFLAQNVDVKILTLPDQLDPAEYLAAHGVDALRSLMSSALEAWEFKYRQLLQKHGVDTLGSRQAVLDEMLSLLGQASNLTGTVREDSLLGRLSQMLRIHEMTVRSRLKGIRSKKAPSANAGAAPAENDDLLRLLSGRLTKHEKLEAEILEILFVVPDRSPFILSRVVPDAFENPYLRQLYQYCCDLHERGIVPRVGAVLSELESEDLKRLCVVLDDWSREKGIQEKLAELDARENLPVFLMQAVENMAWRQEQSRHERSRGEIAGYTSSGGDISEKDRDLLRLAASHHQRRFQKKPAI